jgi:deoxyribodipyrimidine photo-lyase
VIHTPWEADAFALAEAGVVLGKDYPYPVIEHAAGRARALKAYGLFKATTKN